MKNRGRRLDREEQDQTAAAIGRQEERGLLERARRGETEAYADLIRAHQDLIYGLVLRVIGDEALAEELTQDTFIKAHRGLGSFRGDSKFGTWLYRIALNLCHDYRNSQAARIRKRETSLDAPELAGLDPPSSANRPDEAAETSEVEASFRAGLEALSPIYREAFLLRHQEGLSYEEVAEVMGISKTNAKVRVHRAREMVLDTLRSLGWEV